MIICQNHNYDGGEEIPYDSTYVLKHIVIKDNVWFGNRVLKYRDIEHYKTLKELKKFH